MRVSLGSRAEPAHMLRSRDINMTWTLVRCGDLQILIHSNSMKDKEDRKESVVTGLVPFKLRRFRNSTYVRYQNYNRITKHNIQHIPEVDRMFSWSIGFTKPTNSDNTGTVTTLLCTSTDTNTHCFSDYFQVNMGRPPSCHILSSNTCSKPPVWNIAACFYKPSSK